MKALPTRFLAAAGLAAGLLGAASAAHAERADWHVFVGVQPASSAYVQPAPVYVQPRPVYVQPRPGYVAPTPWGYSRRDHDWDDRRWHRRGPYGDRDHDGVPNAYDPDSPRNQRRFARVFGPYGDLDRDGIANRYDRDADGDGIRNRRDRFPRDPYRY